MIDELVAECRTYLGVPWKHQGRSRKGVDCVGFLALAFKSIGITVNEIRGYARKPDGVALKNLMDNQPSTESVSPPYKVGDIVLFRIRREPQHVAILVDSNTEEFGMIHSYNGGKKMVVEHDFAEYWRQKVVSVYRLK